MIAQRLKYAVDFDGEDDKITIKDSQSFDSITSEITIIAWIWFRDPSAYNYQRIVCKSWSAWNPWTIWIYNNRSVLFTITSGGTNYYMITSNTVKHRDWSFLACVFDGDLHVCIDFKWEHKTIRVSGIDTNDLDVVIGNWGRGDRPFNGLIAHISIYNRALTESEIKWNYKNPDNIITDGLVLWLDARTFYPSTGKWYDLSKYNNNGTAYGGVNKVRLVEEEVIMK